MCLFSCTPAHTQTVSLAQIKGVQHLTLDEAAPKLGMGTTQVRRRRAAWCPSPATRRQHPWLIVPTAGRGIGAHAALRMPMSVLNLKH